MQNALVSLGKTRSCQRFSSLVSLSQRGYARPARGDQRSNSENTSRDEKVTNSLQFRKKPFKNRSVERISSSMKRKKVLLDPLTSQETDHPLNHVGRLMTGKANVTTPVTTDEQVDAMLNNEIAALRGGFGDFNGSGGDDYLNSTWSEFFEYAERVDPAVSESLRKPKSLDTTRWLFNKPMPLPKTGQWFQEHMNEWRQGKMMDRKGFLSAFRKNIAEAPLFRKRIAEDPFRKQPYMARRVSYKNVDLLTKFLSPGGNILGRRYTGVTQRTQTKIVREVNKARFLGLISYTGNPKFISPDYQPAYPNKPIRHTMEVTRDELVADESGLLQEMDDDDEVTTKEEEEDDDDNEAEEKEEEPEHPYLKEGFNPDKRLRMYMQNLQDGISPTGKLEWQPTPELLNPRHTVTEEDQEWIGGLPEQVEEKKKILKELLLENLLLKQYGHSLTKEKVKHLTQVLAKQNTATSEETKK